MRNNTRSVFVWKIVIDGLLRYWPKAHCAKAVMFLNELEECLEMGNDADVSTIVVPIFKKLSSCYTSHHFQLAGRSLALSDNAILFKMASQHADLVLPIVIPALKAALHHWHIGIQGHAETALDKWKEVNPDLFEYYERDLANQKDTEIDRINSRINLWVKVETAASRRLKLYFSESE
uniref:FAT domain-containing protein n=1 Tax=Mesocestoides corti TaxID=53468 RepID=A0A5K3F420_MESCO